METEYLKRWRMALGGNAADGTGVTLTVEEQRLDSSLEAVYDSDRRGGLGSSAPKVSRWLGDIREFFPQTVVQVIQRDAIKRLHIDSLLTEKEMLATVVPDVHLVATLMSLGRAIPEKNKDMARQVVRKVVDDLLRKLSSPTQQAVTGALNRSARRRNPRYNEIDWKTTIIKNLKNYQPAVQDRHSGSQDRLRQKMQGSEGHHSLSRPERFNGNFCRLFRHLRFGTGLPAVREHAYGGVRHFGR